jgi:hypothetical protein
MELSYMLRMQEMNRSTKSYRSGDTSKLSSGSQTNAEHVKLRGEYSDCLRASQHGFESQKRQGHFLL